MWIDPNGRPLQVRREIMLDLNEDEDYRYLLGCDPENRKELHNEQKQSVCVIMRLCTKTIN